MTITPKTNSLPINVDNELQSLEQMSVLLYTSSNEEERRKVEEILKDFNTNFDYLNKCKYLLENSHEPFALLFASCSMKNLVAVHWSRFSNQERIDMRNYVLSYISRQTQSTLLEPSNEINSSKDKFQDFRNSSIDQDSNNNGVRQYKIHFVFQSLIHLAARITKLGWMDDPNMQDLSLLSHFLNHSTLSCIIGLSFLNQLVSEMNQTLSFRSPTQNRKIAISFRDMALLDIFQLSLSTLNKFVNTNNSNKQNKQTRENKSEDVVDYDLVEDDGSGSDNSQSESEFENDLNIIRSSSEPFGLEYELLLRQGLLLVQKCLSFDFIGTGSDENDSDLGTIQVPGTWRMVFESNSLLKMFFYLYHLPDNIHGCHTLVLECLVLLASIRRNIFSNETTRNKFLTRLLRGVCQILSSKQRLLLLSNQQQRHYEICRLLSRIKVNHHLVQIVSNPYYNNWITVTTEFTVEHFHNEKNVIGNLTEERNSTYYLLNLWSSMIKSTFVVKNSLPPMLEDSILKILEAYVSSRLTLVQGIIQSENLIEDPLEDEEQLIEQLESLPCMFRAIHSQTSSYLFPLFDNLVQTYQVLQQKLIPKGVGIEGPRKRDRDRETETDILHLSIIESQLAWLVYIISSVIGGRLTMTTSDEFDMIDAEYSARIFQLMKIHENFVTYSIDRNQSSKNNSNDINHHHHHHHHHHQQQQQQQQQQHPHHHHHQNERDDEEARVSLTYMECGFLRFLGNFKKVYIGEQSLSSSKQVYARLSQLLGLENHVMVLNLILSKIGTNLKIWSNNESIIPKTLHLFNEVSTGYGSGILLSSLDTAAYLLTHHTSDYFPFLCNIEKHVRNRTTYYSILGKILSNCDCNQQKFKIFSKPFTLILNSTLKKSPNQLLQNDTIETLIGLFRDLRGVAQTFPSNPKNYLLLFDWLYPKYLRFFSEICDIFYCNFEIIFPLLKFYSEIVNNKNGRISFENSSPNGILLFRETSHLLYVYGNRLLSYHPITGTSKNKGIWLCLTILSRSLSGNYVNFGVFSLYGDVALSQALSVCLRLALSVPLNEILTLPKFSRAYFGFIEILCSQHPTVICNLDAHSFQYIFNSLKKGLKSHDISIVNQCCETIDSFATFRFVKLLNLPNDTDDDSVSDDDTNQHSHPHLHHHQQQQQQLPRYIPVNPVIQEQKKAQEFLTRHLLENPSQFPRLLRTLFKISLFKDSTNQFILSRPIFSLIVNFPSSFTEIQEYFSLRYVPERRGEIIEEFSKLMTDLQPTLETKNRDKFLQNLNKFRQQLKSYL